MIRTALAPEERFPADRSVIISSVEVLSMAVTYVEPLRKHLKKKKECLTGSLAACTVN
jgi:hypothetical protein